jgi:WhiB family redox-sensing transcriptional regulator
MTRPDRARRTKAIAAALTTPGRWAERALCAQADPDAWFPDRGHCDLATSAMRICAHCPVRTQCLDYALSGADTWGGIASGIWGGTTPKERDQLRRQRKAAAA